MVNHVLRDRSSSSPFVYQKLILPEAPQCTVPEERSPAAPITCSRRPPLIMFRFPADRSLRLFDKRPPMLNHHEASPPFPPPKLDASSSSPLFPLSPLIFDHELLNDITLLAPPPQISSISPPLPPLPSPPNKPSSALTNPYLRAAALCDLDKSCGTRPAKEGDGGGTTDAGGRRRLRKDRHSKICTAQGTRDRRMRLSLDVARKFFELQDTLGFDKASKTVDWLLGRCKSSIMELTGSSSPRRHPAPLDAVGNAKSESSISECEVMSASINHAPPAARAKRAAVRRPRDAAAHPPPSRQKRQMARARARERTRKKNMLKRHEFEGGGGQRKLQPAVISSPNPFETGEDSGRGTHTAKSSWDDQMVAEEGQLINSRSPDHHYKTCSAAASQLPEVAVAAGGSSAPISIFDYGQNIARNGDDISFVEKHHSWDIIRPSGSAEEQRLLFADAQLQLFLWEAFNTSCP